MTLVSYEQSTSKWVASLINVKFNRRVEIANIIIIGATKNLTIEHIKDIVPLHMAQRPLEETTRIVGGSEEMCVEVGENVSCRRQAGDTGA